jgi:threonine dehydrogenase-like Zn-dependent dehydrogenase
MRAFLRFCAEFFGILLLVIVGFGIIGLLAAIAAKVFG